MGGSLTLSISQSGNLDCGAPCYGLPSEGHGEVSEFMHAFDTLRCRLSSAHYVSMHVSRSHPH